MWQHRWIGRFAAEVEVQHWVDNLKIVALIANSSNLTRIMPTKLAQGSSWRERSNFQIAWEENLNFLVYLVAAAEWTLASFNRAFGV